LLVWFSVLGFFFSGILVFKLFQFIEPTYRINQLNLARQIQVTFFLFVSCLVRFDFGLFVPLPPKPNVDRDGAW
jgi:hypothetical protein